MQSLEEELTRKEERWNATFTRLKNKAEVKEKECEELHQQISVLEQEKIALWEKEVPKSFLFLFLFLIDVKLNLFLGPVDWMMEKFPLSS